MLSPHKNVLHTPWHPDLFKYGHHRKRPEQLMVKAIFLYQVSITDISRNWLFWCHLYMYRRSYKKTRLCWNNVRNSGYLYDSLKCFFLFLYQRTANLHAEWLFWSSEHSGHQSRPQSWTCETFKRGLAKIPLKSLENFWWPKKLRLGPGKRKEDSATNIANHLGRQKLA